MSIFFRVLFFAVFCVGCATQQSELNPDIFKVKLGTKNPNEIGFLKDEATGEIASISSIYVIDKNVLLLDPVYNNIKALEADTGVIRKVSNSLSDEAVWVSDIIAFDSLIYVASYKNIVYVLDYSLNKIKEYQVDHPFGEKRFFLDHDKLYICTYTSDFWQDSKYRVFVSATEMSNGALKKDTISTGEGYESYAAKLAGYSIRKDDGSFCILNSDSCFKIELPTVPYAARNVFVNERTLAFYQLERDSLKVTLYELR